MSNVKIWYPQLDTYDSIRRMISIAYDWPDKSLSSERLYITDFLISNPPLIHDVTMSKESKIQFLSFKIPKKNKSFLQYPAAIILFQQMKEVQTKALQTLIAKGVFNPKSYESGQIELTEIGKAIHSQIHMESVSDNEKKLVNFLSNHFSLNGNKTIEDIRKETGLRRPV